MTRFLRFASTFALILVAPLAACSGTCNSSGQKSLVFDLPGVRVRSGPPVEEVAPREFRTVKEYRDVSDRGWVREAPVTREDPCAPKARAYTCP